MPALTPTLMLIVLAVGLLWSVNYFWNYRGSREQRAFANLVATATAAALAVPSPTSAIVVFSPTAVPSPTPTLVPLFESAASVPVGVEPVILEVTKVVEVPAPYEVVVEVPVEVTRVVEVQLQPVPTATLQPDTVRLCVDTGPGVTGLYLDGAGVPSGCVVRAVGAVTDVEIRVTGRNNNNNISSDSVNRQASTDEGVNRD